MIMVLVFLFLGRFEDVLTELGERETEVRVEPRLAEQRAFQGEEKTVFPKWEGEAPAEPYFQESVARHEQPRRDHHPEGTDS
jgi:hypothetical protein